MSALHATKAPSPTPLLPSRPGLLRGGLAFNAAWSSACATALMVWTDSISVAVALPTTELLALALSLVGFVVLLLWQVRRRSVHLLAALLTSLADIGWVATSGIYMAATDLSPMGLLMVGGVALGVAAAATLQLAGLRRLIREPDPTLGTTHRYVWSTHIDAVPREIWPAISDLAAISDYSAGLETSALRPGPTHAAGAVRDCSNPKGEAWSERVVAWEDGRAIDLEFLADAPGFPFPMTKMLGGWRLSGVPGGSVVQVYWSFDLRQPALAMLAVPLLALQIERSFPAVIRAMADPGTSEGDHHARASAG